MTTADVGRGPATAGVSHDDRRRIRRAFAIVVVIAAVWNVVGNLVLPGPLYVPANLLVAGGMVAVARWAGLGWSPLGLERRTVGSGLAVGLLAALVIAAVLAVGVLLPVTRGAFADDAVAMQSVAERWYDALVRIPLGTAVFEEVLFRSVLLGLASVLLSRTGAVAVTSLLFGLWHVVPAWEGASGGAAATVGGIVGTVAITSAAGVGFAWLRQRSGSVLAPILAHTATNSFAYVAAVVALDVLDA